MKNNQADLLENIAIVVVFVSLFLLQSPLLFMALCVLFSIWQLWKNRAEVAKKFKWTWQLFVTSAIALFLAKISATHHFNSKYGIYPEYLNHSITVWTAITACTFLILPLLWNCLKFFVVGLAEKSFFKSFKNAIYSITFIIMWYLLIMAYVQVAQYDRWLLILDAYSHSDCQPSRGGLAIRKNNEACYLFTFKMPIQLEMKEVPSVKP